MTDIAVELCEIDKSFGAVQANRGVSLAVRRGTIHGLVGENGAGKSTAMSILYGYYQPDAGEIRVGGRPVRIRSSADAIALGIGMVHQHFMLVDDLTVAENLMLGSENGLGLAAARRHAEATIARAAGSYGLALAPAARVGNLPVGLRQRVEIVKALHRGAEFLILDEPTAALTPQESDRLFAMLRRLADDGGTVILITHKLREIERYTDAVTVMRDGEVVAHRRTADTSSDELAELMVGRRLAPPRAARPGAATNGTLPVLEVEGLTLTGTDGQRALRGIDLAVRAGEIVGIAGVAGNGQSELLAALAGLAAPAPGGRIRLNGADVTRLGVQARRRLGVRHIPEDRLQMGLVPDFTAAENLILGDEGEPWASTRRLGLLRVRRIAETARRHLRAYDVRPPFPGLRTALLSGGNQQKLVCAREMERRPALLLVGQPTRGVDIGATELIHDRLRALREAGAAILLVSVELDEIRELADRILVMAGGAIVGEVPAALADDRTLGLMMAGIQRPAAGASDSGAGTPHAP
ncbi:MAG TPA: ABC transporter ATP-binding protein [Stellaceae bacterium]